MLGLRIKMLIGKQGAVKPLFLMTLCCHLNTLLSFAVFAVENLARQYLRKNGMTEITIRCTNCGLRFESDYDLEQNLVDQDTGEIHDGCPTCETDAYLMDLIKYPDLEPTNDQ